MLWLFAVLDDAVDLLQSLQAIIHVKTGVVESAIAHVHFGSPFSGSGITRLAVADAVEISAKSEVDNADNFIV